MVVVAAMAVSTEGCGSAAGIVQGRVLVFSPVPHPETPTSSPIARFSSTVEAERGKQIVAEDTALPGAQFHFVLSPGVYVLSVPGVPFCRTPVRIVSARTVRANVRCVEP
jgi:hypothetical protein